MPPLAYDPLYDDPIHYECIAIKLFLLRSGFINQLRLLSIFPPNVTTHSSRRADNINRSSSRQASTSE
jgi:hypothetical protein